MAELYDTPVPVSENEQDIVYMQETVRRLRREKVVLRGGLIQAVRLLSHYAEMLNSFDEGRRRTFADADEFLARIKELAQQS